MNTVRNLCVGLIFLLGACIDDKDVGLDGAEGGGGSSMGASEGGSSSSEGGSSSSETGAAETGAAETTSGAGSSGGSGGEEQQLCESSGGVWDPLSCGDYVCGVTQDCRAIDPGCDCGVGSTLVEGVGCVADDACESVEFDCAGESCTAPGSYCDVWGASVVCLETPPECEGSYTCGCLADAVGGACEKQDDGSIFVYVPGGP